MLEAKPFSERDHSALEVLKRRKIRRIHGIKKEQIKEGKKLDKCEHDRVGCLHNNLLLLALQPTVGFSLLSDFLPFRSFLALLSPPSYSHYLQIFINACNPSLPWSPSSSRTYRFLL
jgi:hypothetical protein